MRNDRLVGTKIIFIFIDINFYLRQQQRSNYHIHAKEKCPQKPIFRTSFIFYNPIDYLSANVTMNTKKQQKLYHISFPPNVSFRSAFFPDHYSTKFFETQSVPVCAMKRLNENPVKNISKAKRRIM